MSKIPIDHRTYTNQFNERKYHTVGWCGCGYWHYADELGRPMIFINGKWIAGKRYPKTPQRLRMSF